MKRLFFSIFFIGLFLSVACLLTEKNSVPTNFYSKIVEQEEMMVEDVLKSGLFSDNDCSASSEVLFDQSLQRAGASHVPTIRRIQIQTSLLLLRFQAEMKKHYSFLQKESTSLTLIALRRATSFPILAFSRTVDFYVFSFGHILH